MLGNTSREYLAWETPFWRPSALREYIWAISCHDLWLSVRAKMSVSLHASSGVLLGVPVKSPRSASCLEPFQIRKRPASNIAFLCHKKRPIPIFGKWEWDAVRNEMGLLSVADALLSRLLCRLEHAGILACRFWACPWLLARQCR